MSHPNRPRGPAYDLPVCDIKIGTVVHPAMIFSCPINGAYYRQMIVRGVIKEHQKILRHPYCKDIERTGRKLPPKTKENIRAHLNAVFDAYEAEIVGIVPFALHIGSTSVANQCYVGGETGWSGVSWRVRLLFRSVNPQNNHVATIPNVDFSYHTVKQGFGLA